MNWKFWLRLILSIFLIVWIIIKVDLRAIISALGQIKPMFWMLFLIPFPLAVFLNSFSVYYLLRRTGAAVGYWRTFKFKFISRALCLFFPSQMGDLALGPLMKIEGVQMGQTLAVVTIDKMVSFMVMSLAGAYALWVYFGWNVFLRVMVFLVAFLVISLMLISSATVRGWIKKYFLRKYAHLFQGYYHHFAYIWKEEKKAIFVDFLITVLWLLLTSTVIFGLFKSVGVTVNIGVIASIQGVGALSSVLPISLSGAGVRESIVVYLFSLLEVSYALTAGMFLVFLSVSYLWAAVALMLYSKEFNVGLLRKMFEEKKKNEHFN